MKTHHTKAQLHKENKYNEMVIYWEACHSGSMFVDLPSNINVYAVSSTNETEKIGKIPCEAKFDTVTPWGETH